MIDERQVAELLRAATDDISVQVPPTRELAGAGSRRRRRRRWAVAGVAAAAVAAVSVAVPLALGSAPSGRTGASGEPTTTTPGASCADPVPTRVLPDWARTGFTDPRPRMPYVLGDGGDIAAILFAQPLTAPPSADHNNKILWVSPVADGSSLRITATLADGSATATRVVDGGPGPSIIDLPRTGCWHLTLQWAGRTDTMDLAYVAP
ncbi:hypothetical protein [Nocardioides sp. URHA0032]|uniref:hypothetical protein n=1 Tax=Nocardioides sp. URHA0032 TaxID=1380388 RepID=UPI000ACD43A6|nr:hypothetical protein [Nocardioides sp. URHA0032]